MFYGNKKGRIRPLPEGGPFLDLYGLLFFFLSRKFCSSAWEVVTFFAAESIGTIGGAHNFCMHKLNCRLAGLVYV